ncbi:GAF domain-containing SpoIIE family protein phosphatase [Kitasatospora terrestris]|uniref:Uncharacterized protein n=1 Tax=Kitasatospora terrestris TaxID=258051 RepID=A0ABP9DCP3_9ACTN
MEQPEQGGEQRTDVARVSMPGLGEDDLDRIQAGLRQIARTHGRMQELLAAVLAVSRELDLDAVLHIITDTARQLVGARYAALGVLDEDGAFTQLVTAGEGAQAFAALGDRMPHGEGILGDLVRHPAPLRVDDLGTHPHAQGFPEGHPPMTTLLGVPVLVRERVYGNLYLADKTDGTSFTDVDQDIVTALAGAAGVAIENARLYQQLRRATEDFQRRLLPAMPTVEGLELHVRYQPATQAPRIGGDWYDLVRLADRVPCLVIGDVMGHGIEAAALMSQISNMLRVIAYDEQEPPSRILRRLDEVLHELHDAPMATVTVARLEPHPGGGRLLRWASAGHLPPLVAVPGGRAFYLPTDAGPPLGVEPELHRTDHEEHLPVGATVVLHTDGLVERRDHPIDHTMAHLARTAAARTADPLPDLCDALLGEQQVLPDDVALLAVRVTA